jgi:hypothetical protein
MLIFPHRESGHWLRIFARFLCSTLPSFPSPGGEGKEGRVDTANRQI